MSSPVYYEWIDTRKKSSAAVKSMQMMRENVAAGIDIAVEFHAEPIGRKDTSPVIGERLPTAEGR